MGRQILNCRPISYVSSGDLEEPVTPSHLVVNRRLSALPEIDIPADADFRISPDDLSSRARHLDMILSHFWKRWRAEYLLELRNAHNQLKKTAGSRVVSVGDLVLVHDETHPKSYWKMGKVKRLLMSKDGQSRGAEARVQGRGWSEGGLLRRPLQLFYPLEVSCSTNETAPQEQVPESPEQPTQGGARGNWERRRAVVEGERIRRQWTLDCWITRWTLSFLDVFWTLNFRFSTYLFFVVCTKNTRKSIDTTGLLHKFRWTRKQFAFSKFVSTSWKGILKLGYL